MADPLCPYFGECGGCAFQDVDYAAQLENKRARLAESIRFDGIQVFSGKEYFYRHRMDMVFHEGGIGLRQKGSWRKIVDIERCVISNEPLNQLVTEVREFFEGVDFFDVRKRIGTFRYAVIRTPPEDSSISIVLNRDSEALDLAIKKIREFAAQTSAENVLVTLVPYNTDVSVSEDYAVIKGEDQLREYFLGKTFHYSVQGFFQNNHDLTEKMHAYCRSLLKRLRSRGDSPFEAADVRLLDAHGTTPLEAYDANLPDAQKTANACLLDLYGGVGTFGLINADLFRKVIIVDNYSPAVEAAVRNAAENGIANVRTALLDAKRLRTLELPQPLYVIVDPPRSGIHAKALKRVGELRPEVILYVSCSLKQLGLDLEKLEDYDIASVALFDLFPQTPHMEAVVELTMKA